MAEEAAGVTTMVLQWNNAAEMNVWMDLRHNCRTRSGLVKMLKRGVRRGHWIGWRIITIDEEGGMG